MNSTFKAAPWADALFAMDKGWWDTYLTEVRTTFLGALYSTNALPISYQVKRLNLQSFKGYGNSGAASVSLAAKAGARRVIMLGFDCQKTGGKSHWHGDHPKNLGNCGAMDRWHKKFAEMARDLSGREIINASRETALGMFPRMPLEQALNLP